MEELSFNDLPKVMSQVLDKVEGLEKALNGLKDELGSKRNHGDGNGHIPMTIDEACEFLRMKKSTMYYNLEHERSISFSRMNLFTGWREDVLILMQ